MNQDSARASLALLLLRWRQGVTAQLILVIVRLAPGLLGVGVVIGMGTDEWGAIDGQGPTGRI